MSGQRPQVFISYSHADSDAVRGLADALAKTDLRVWIDERRIDTFESIQASIEKGLSQSAAVLTWYSPRYAASRACQWELTAAFMAAQQAGDVRARILVVNTERSNVHIEPVELRDSRYLEAPGSANDLRTAADAIARHVSALKGSLAADRAFTRPEWHGGTGGQGTNRFVGRLRELWMIHSGLWSREVPIITGARSRALVRLTGLGGAGKSVLAEEYGLRFGAAYPGGIFWLRAFGHDLIKGPLDDREREMERARQFASMAASVGVAIDGLSPEDLTSKLARELDRRGPYLWIIDDLPSSLAWSAAAQWMAPTARGCTLVTTRAGADHWAGATVSIDELEPDAAYALLTHRRAPGNAQEAADARGLAADLGGHALALELAAATAARRPYGEVRSRLADRSKDVLDLAAQLLDANHQGLPQREGANLNIAQTLLSSIEALGDAGLDVLRVAASIAPVPISRDLLVRTLASASNLSAPDAEDRADLALADVEGQALVRSAGDARIQVHTLVSRTMRFRSRDRDRDRVMRLAAMRALNAIEAAAEPSSWGPAYVEHARTLARTLEDERTALTGDEARQLVGLLAGLSRSDDQLYLDLAYGETMRRRIYEISEQILGEGDRDTLFAMNELALMYLVTGSSAVARTLQEQLVARARDALGEHDPETNTLTANLIDTLEAVGDRTAAAALRQRLPEGTRYGTFRRTPP